MADPSAGVDHRQCASFVGNGPKFPGAWPGSDVNMANRRAYMRSFLKWAAGMEKGWERKSRSIYEDMIARDYASREFMGAAIFEWAVDAAIWKHSFLNAKPRAPPIFPFRRPGDTEGGPSATFARLRTKYVPNVRGSQQGGQQGSVTSTGSAATQRPSSSQKSGQSATPVAESSREGTTSGATRALDDAQEDTAMSEPAFASTGTGATGGLTAGMIRSGVKRKDLADSDGEEEPDTKIPKTGSSERLQQGQTHLAVVHQDKVYIQSPEAASIEGRKRLYALYCEAYGSQENPFEMELPAVLDFHQFVWGKMGDDWATIQDFYLPDYIRLTWGYMGGIPKDAVPYKHVVSPEVVAKVGHVLTIGLKNKNDREPYHCHKVFDIWKAILQWRELCLADRPKPLILAIHQMAMDSFRLATQPCTRPREDLAERQMKSVLDRKGCSVQIERILQKGGQEVEKELDKWLMGESTSTCLSVGDRIEIIDFLWYRRASSVDELNRCERWFKSAMAKYGHPSR
ncbi:hypothetical protein FMEXI_10266 [Fusarium mexicanum]|uniref:Uncharacterized protein n=1 Tax=Fusarium mexicanum TaxID=751941 RepID=A0A8H5IGW0_9HYPO|nr:hypothetical protein FMEXI_10266 [Fusarium mexicanum]